MLFASVPTVCFLAWLDSLCSVRRYCLWLKEIRSPCRHPWLSDVLWLDGLLIDVTEMSEGPDLNCTISFISDEFFHLLEFYVHNDAPLTCRIPARPLTPAVVVAGGAGEKNGQAAGDVSATTTAEAGRSGDYIPLSTLSIPFDFPPASRQATDTPPVLSS